MPLEGKLAAFALRYCYGSTLADSVAGLSAADMIGRVKMPTLHPAVNRPTAAVRVASGQACSGTALLVVRSNGEGDWHT